VIDVNNWGHCCYSSGEFRSSISLGASLSSENDAKLEYFINKFHGEDLIFQESFNSIEEAITKINLDYKYWSFIDLEKKLHSGGCSTCQAH